MRELDLQVQRVQNKHAHLSEAFAESTRQITAKGVEDFEKTKKQFQSEPFPEVFITLEFHFYILHFQTDFCK